MLHVALSNRPEELLGVLIDNLARERAGRSAYEASCLVVPNRAQEALVKVALADAHGVAANLDALFLRGLWSRVAARALGGARLVDVAHLEGELLDLLADADLLSRPDMHPLGAYLAVDEPADLRRATLAAELARLFDEYAVSRPDELDRWQDGRPWRHGSAGPGRAQGLARAHAPATEGWQSALWRAIFGKGGLRDRRAADQGARWLLPGELAAALSGDAWSAERLDPVVHVFGLSFVGHVHHQLLAALARKVEVHVYAPNPCRVLSDAAAAAQLDLLPAAGDGDPASEGAHPLVRAWGRPGRENLTMFLPLVPPAAAGSAVRPCYREHARQARTLLQRIQDDVLGGVSRAVPDAAARADDSLSLIPCPGVRRELETVAAEIWKHVRSDPTLALTDIAVLVPDAVKAQYLALLPSVFHESHGLPHAVLDPVAGPSARLIDAALRLVELPLGTLSRREALPLLTHPNVLARFPGVEPDTWARLAERLGIVMGADRRDHAQSYVARDLYSWDQGLRRLGLGLLMAGDDGEGGQGAAGGGGVSFGDDEYLPARLDPDEAEAAAPFSLVVRSLIEDTRFASGADGPRERPLVEWLDFIRGLVAAYLRPTDESEEALLARVQREIDAVAETPARRPVGYRVAAFLVGRALAGLAARAAPLYPRGVRVSSLAQRRGVPHRLVFIVGLGQGCFPSGDAPAALDLRRAFRRPGDVTPREHDLYLFLEALIETRERLVLSYVARDETTGETREPSPVVLEMLELVARSMLPPGEAERLRQDPPPLRRFDDAERAWALPAAARERESRALGRALRAGLPHGVVPPDLPALRRALPGPVFDDLARRLALVLPPDRDAGQGPTAGTGPEARLLVPLRLLTSFLVDPLQGSAAFRLHMRDADDDGEARDVDHEPFERGPLPRTRFLRAAMRTALAAGGAPPSPADLDEAIRVHARQGELGGEAPTGLFAEADLARCRSVLEGWQAHLAEVTGGSKVPPRFVRFGRPRQGDAAGEVRPPIAVAVDAPDGQPDASARVRAEITGALAPMVESGGRAPASLMFSSSSRNDDTRRARSLLRAFLEHVALAAAGEAPCERDACHIWSSGDRSALHRTRFRALDQDRARRYLADLLADLVGGTRDAAGRPTGVHAYLMPYEAVLDAWASRDFAATIEDLRDAYLTQGQAVLSSAYGPVPDAVARHRAPPPAEAEDMARRRFGLYFDLREDAP